MSEVKLEEVLEEYTAETPAGNDLNILKKAAEKHREYAGELADYAAARAVARHAPEEELSPEEETRAQKSGIKNLRMILGELNSAPKPAAAFESLTEAAKGKGMNKKEFAASLGLSVSLVQYLEKRRLEFASIPHAIIGRLAEALNAGEELIAAYLDQSPDTAAQASFKAAERAEELPPKDFAEAVREDQQLSAEEKRTLLEL